MRIIAGQWRGRKVDAPPGEGTRPTADRTRETLFSMLHSRLGGFEDLAVADFFAGSGALGLEALSRGAASCLFVEQDAAAIKAIRANIAALDCAAACDVRASSVLSVSPSSTAASPSPRIPHNELPYNSNDTCVCRATAAVGAGAILSVS